MVEFEKTLGNKLAYIGTDGQEHLKKIKVHIKTLTLDILKEDIDRLEGEFYIKNGASMCENKDNALGYNKALQDQIDYYQEQIKEINQTL